MHVLSASAAPAASGSSAPPSVYRQLPIHSTTMWQLLAFCSTSTALVVAASLLLIPTAPLPLLLFPSSLRGPIHPVSARRTATMLSVFGPGRGGKQNDTMLAAAALTSSHGPVNG